MLAVIREDFFHYTHLRAKYVDSSRSIATMQRLTARKTWKTCRRCEFFQTAGEVGLAAGVVAQDLLFTVGHQDFCKTRKSSLQTIPHSVFWVKIT